MQIDYEGLISKLTICYRQPALGAALSEIESIRSIDEYRHEILKDATDANIAILAHVKKRADLWIPFSKGESQS